jgi:hypothetical protein
MGEQTCPTQTQVFHYVWRSVHLSLSAGILPACRSLDRSLDLSLSLPRPRPTSRSLSPLRGERECWPLSPPGDLCRLRSSSSPLTCSPLSPGILRYKLAKCTCSQKARLWFNLCHGGVCCLVKHAAQARRGCGSSPLLLLVWSRSCVPFTTWQRG